MSTTHLQDDDENRRVLLVGNFLKREDKVPSYCSALAARLEQDGMCVLTTSRRCNRVWRTADMLGTAWRCRRRYDVAVVDVFSGRSFLWAEAVCWVLRRARRPYVLVLRGGDLPVFAAGHVRRVTRLLGSAAAVTAPSAYLSEQMEPYREDIAILPNAIDLQAYRFRIRRGSRPNLVWLRAFHEIYNPSLAVRVVASLRPAWPDIRLVMAGPDKGDGSFEGTRDAARQLGVEDRVEYRGLVPKEAVPAFLGSGDIYLNTPNVDNTPISLLEAMACGLCVVTTNVGGIPCLTRHEHDSLVVDADNPEDMSAAVDRILSDAALAAKLSENARRRVESMDWAHVIPRWKDMLLSATGSGVR